MGCFGSKDKLSKEDMDFLKSHTRYDEATIKEWYKGFKQDCPNGRLTPAKFVDMYKMFFPSGNAEEFCDHVFRTFDMDKNGYIDFKEFLLAIDVTSSGTPEEKLKWAFRMYDVDGNGVIDMQEMTKIVQVLRLMYNACASIYLHLVALDRDSFDGIQIFSFFFFYHLTSVLPARLINEESERFDIIFMYNIFMYAT
ncbi:neuronal calcium sensor 2 isoform X1 [Camponotus floridanus]|uniref:neuronal calcium sensor 2 isoform X1 n=1 Tax=Camponotus floridanus TaxID=104421 RepID=UPI000DC6BF6B|nr:neuronal calcium sensor 2 isoform X1 [Camponotus floridanus]XP_025263575.1 neuronal calcium sensor 2 isoform X1 [Camponotus floridanus]XP_025263576.1 neuronal calcium sensor 2 isoform X1 [Camponotus floridanus]XP_025263577.1 neuronal calcium sensor 2 isoform X1 [Camponotus floridanus]XP_025263580.1 neuronal calcium sensor 2 isoform X1 [Camponotus floridanus]